MAENSIELLVAFSYRGEEHTPTAVIDLDEVMLKGGGITMLHITLARLNGIDPYSYLYEVMEMAPLQYINPKGLAVSCFADGEFDLEGYRQLWQEQQQLERLQPLASHYLGVEDLGSNPQLRQVLLEAYRLGLAES